jgi:hypothetical protein
MEWDPQADPLEYSFGGFDHSQNHVGVSADGSNEHQFLEEFKARDEEFLSAMRNYEYLGFKDGMEEARTFAMELAGKKPTIKKEDIFSMFTHAGGWKIRNLEKDELLRAMGKRCDGDSISVEALQEFLATTSIGQNAANHVFQPKLSEKICSVIIQGFPMKTTVAYVNSLCSEHGIIQRVDILDSVSKKSKHSAHMSFLVKFADEHSACRAVQKLHGYSSKRVPGPLSCQLVPEEANCVVAIAPS